MFPLDEQLAEAALAPVELATCCICFCGGADSELCAGAGLASRVVINFQDPFS